MEMCAHKRVNSTRQLKAIDIRPLALWYNITNFVTSHVLLTLDITIVYH